jgi:16S rRNA (cytosine1402-N4)-methyltransferase
MSGREAEFTHRPVLLEEILAFFEHFEDGSFVDATLGLGGHSEAILDRLAKSTVLGIDQDQAAIAAASERLAKFGDRFRAEHANFSAIGRLVDAESVDGIVADLGVSSMQLDDESRGFSFRFDAPLDMRMNRDEGQTAAELIDELDQETLANIIYEYGEERHSRKIARRIIEKREAGEPIETTRQLAELIERTIRRKPNDKIHVATRTFQALRIAVNQELEVISDFLDDSLKALKTGGVLAVITFHSLEDRIVKNRFQRLAGKCVCPPRIPQCVCGAAKRIEILIRKPMVPAEQERDENPRSRSAKLRAFRKI